MKLRFLFLAVGAVGVLIAGALKTSQLLASAGHTWTPFVLVTGLLLIGTIANEDGMFTAAAALLDRIPGGPATLYLSSMLLVAVVTVLLNLDTAVAFLTPVLLLASRRREAGEERFLYGCVFMANAASLLLPGSNLTNLLILSGEHVNGSVFLGRMLAPWAAATLVTAVVVGLAFHGGAAGRLPEQPTPSRVRRASPIGMGLAILFMLSVADAAIPVLVIGLLLTTIRLAQKELPLRLIQERIDMLSLVGVFLIAVALGTLARSWSYPGHLMAAANSIESAGIGAVSSVLVNNLPAAVLLGSQSPAHPRSLLLGLNIGPNLAVTGSLSALIWWQAARTVGARPSARRYSIVGAVLVPVTLAMALLATGHSGGLP
ncbi:MAG: SLC13 family permease [Candidatus Dormibacteria bacterium]